MSDNALEQYIGMLWEPALFDVPFGVWLVGTLFAAAFAFAWSMES